MEPLLDKALSTYAQQAARNWGTAPDETFVQAHRESLGRHEEKSQISEIVAPCLAMNDVLPGQPGHSTITDSHTVTMYFGFESEQTLPTHLGEQATLDVLAAVAVERRQGYRGRNDELYTAHNYLLDKSDRPIDAPQLLGQDGRREGRNRYNYSKLAIAHAVGSAIINDMTALRLSFAARARLPGAPYEMLQCGLQLSVIGEANARRHIAESAADTTQTRLAMEETGIPVTAANVNAYYEAAFRHPVSAEEAVSPLVQPLAEASHQFHFSDFRARHERAVTLLHFLGSQSRIVTLPPDKPAAFF